MASGLVSYVFLHGLQEVSKESKVGQEAVIGTLSATKPYRRHLQFKVLTEQVLFCPSLTCVANACMSQIV